MRELTMWVTPFTGLGSLDEAIGAAQDAASSVSTKRAKWHPNLLIPVHYGEWAQSACRQNLPDDMRASCPADVAPMRERVEAAGLGFGVWGVPHTAGTGRFAASFAAVAGYYAANFEPAEFWLPGDDPAAVDQWWQDFWDQLASQADELAGNVVATAIPNRWGLSAFALSLSNLAAGCGALALEVYGGLQTAGEYPPGNLWPKDGFAEIRATGVDANLIPILARANLQSQITLANRLGHGQVQVWCL